MELATHSECCDKRVDDKDLVNMYGGVAYDHDSMPKLLAVHFSAHERMNSGVNHAEKPQCSTVESMIKNWRSILIGIRSSSEGLGELTSQRSYIDLKEHLESVTNVKGVSLTEFGLEHFIQGNSRAYNSISSTSAAREFYDKRSPYNGTLVNNHDNSDTKYRLSCDKIATGDNQAGKSLIRHLLLNKNEDNFKCSAAVAELIPPSETWSSSVNLSANSFTASDLGKQNNDKLETLEWRNVGVLADTQKYSFEFYTDKNSKLFTDKDLKASSGNDCRQRKADESVKTENTPTSSMKTHDFPVGKDIGIADRSEADKKNPKSSFGSVKLLEINPLGCDAKKRQTDCLIPRKRPRKSFPKKLNPGRGNFDFDLLSNCSEETLSADEITPELSPQRCTSVASPVHKDGCTSILSSRRDLCKPVVSFGKGQQNATAVAAVKDEQSSIVASFEEEVKGCEGSCAEREEQRSPVVSTEKEKKSVVAVQCNTELPPEKEVQSISKVSLDKRDLSEACVLPESMGSHRVSHRETKIVFKRTGGVWSVSSPTNLGVGADRASKEMCSSGKPMQSTGNVPNAAQDFNDLYREKPTEKICVFTGRPIASLLSAEEPCFSSALDREARIKELLIRQEKLLAQMRQQTVTSQN